MSQLLTVGDMVAVNAARFPDKLGTMDSRRRLTFAQWNERACRLAHALRGLGVMPGDRVAVVARNCVEWMEIYVATAKAGMIVVPVNFRLSAGESMWVINDAQPKAMLVATEFVPLLDGIRAELCVPDGGFIHLPTTDEPTPAGFVGYENIVAAGVGREPEVRVNPSDPWTLLHTSGTTGRPKGVVRTHESFAAFYLINAAEFGFFSGDCGLSVMPMCHVNSIFYSFVFTYRGASACVYDAAHFDPEHLLRTLAQWRISFTSLVPTHFHLVLDLPAATRESADVSCVRKLLISSAPARRETKLTAMEFFRNSELYEAYGSTEAGIVTLLRPEEQLDHVGSIGREVLGTGRIRLLDEAGNDVPDGEVGELYSRTPMTFSHYWNLPERTATAFRGDYCTVGDLGRRDADGFYFLVDRKHNMIITGGENVFPSEVEAVVAAHPAVKDVAVIGVPHDVWGEAVTAVVVPRNGETIGETALIDFCRDRIAGYKRPRTVVVIADAEMPRTATGKILHRVLRDRFASPPPSGA